MEHIFENQTFDEERALYGIKNALVKNCTMENCDRAFERSSVQADVAGRIESVKNVLSGTVIADAIGEVIMEEVVVDSANSQIIERSGQR